MTPDEASKVKRAEAILVRNYVDTSLVDVDVHKNSIYITGELHVSDIDSRIKDPTERMIAVRRTCMTIEQDIRRIGEVHDIQWKLSNWQRVGNRWIPKKA